MIYIFDKELSVKETPDSHLILMNSLASGAELINNVPAFRIVCRAETEQKALNLVAEHFLIKREEQIHFDESSNGLDFSSHQNLIKKLKSYFPEYLI